jgi:hypothetical protein
MRERPEIWLVVHGEELVAELEVERRDAPWLHGRALRRPGFSALSSLFDGKQRLAACTHPDPDAWASAYRRLRAAVRLIAPDGREAPEFILHIDGARARWRSWTPAPATAPDVRSSAGGPPSPRQRLVRPWLAAGLLALLVAIALPAVASARSPRHQHSANWAGYVVTAQHSFKTVSGRWVQPVATCDQPFDTYAAFWVGLGGFTANSNGLEQIGTDADCTHGHRAVSYAWFEIIPAPPVKLNLAVRPGDVLSARVTADAGNRIVLQLHNLTTHHQMERTVTVASPDLSSAEWIAEAPSACASAGNCQTLPLTDFGTVQFTRATAGTALGQAGTIADPAFTTTEITLSAGAPALGPQPARFSGATSEAKPSALQNGGRSFAVTYEQSANPTGSPPPLGAYLRH